MKGGHHMEQRNVIVDAAVCLAKCAGSGRCKCVTGSAANRALDIGRITINLFK